MKILGSDMLELCPRDIALRSARCYDLDQMAIAPPTSDSGRLSAEFARQLVQAWVNSCNDFLHWQRRELIERRATPQTSSDHRQTLKVMLRLGRSFFAQASDP